MLKNASTDNIWLIFFCSCLFAGHEVLALLPNIYFSCLTKQVNTWDLRKLEHITKNLKIGWWHGLVSSLLFRNKFLALGHRNYAEVDIKVFCLCSTSLCFWIFLNIFWTRIEQVFRQWIKGTWNLILTLIVDILFMVLSYCFRSLPIFAK